MVFAGEVEAGKELGAAVVGDGGSGEGFEGGALGGEVGFAGFDEVVGEEDGGVVRELTKVLLSPCFGIVEGRLKFGGVEGKSAADGVVNGDAGAVEEGADF